MQWRRRSKEDRLHERGFHHKVSMKKFEQKRGPSEIFIPRRGGRHTYLSWQWRRLVAHGCSNKRLGVSESLWQPRNWVGLCFRVIKYEKWSKKLKKDNPRLIYYESATFNRRVARSIPVDGRVLPSNPTRHCGLFRHPRQRRKGSSPTQISARVYSVEEPATVEPRRPLA